jgi:hypothetical protein
MTSDPKGRMFIVSVCGGVRLVTVAAYRRGIKITQDTCSFADEVVDIKHKTQEGRP